jgi:hypothetical protein
MGDIEIGEPAVEPVGGASRVSALVGGDELWFESHDLALAPSIEGFLSALVPAAVGRGLCLVPRTPVDREWLGNVAGVLTTWHDWWGTPRDLEAVMRCTPRDRSPTTLGPTGVGLCFSLGVDSFHTLLRSGRYVDRLVLAAGYDLPLDDDARLAHACEALDAVAGATGTRGTVIRTNLRTHPIGRPTPSGETWTGPGRTAGRSPVSATSAAAPSASC